MKNKENIRLLQDLLPRLASQLLAAEFEIAGVYYAGIVSGVTIADDDTITIDFHWVRMVRQLKFGHPPDDGYDPTGVLKLSPNLCFTVKPKKINLSELEKDTLSVLSIESQGESSETYFRTSNQLEKARVEQLLPLCT